MSAIQSIGFHQSTTSNDVLVECEGVSKKFCRDLKRSLWYGVKDSTSDLFQTLIQPDLQLRNGEFWANHDIAFVLKRGECAALVGRNGAGKTTFLKLLTGLIKPDAGVIRIRGQLSAMIALGAGFNPILTARENIAINGAVLGASPRQVREKLEEIIDFAELEEFIDTPVRSYSSGMMVRLGFAVAAILIQPDILILDEVLAVGDFRFRNKCMNRLSQTLKSCATILVSHQESQIRRICTRGIYLESGRIVFSGDVDATLSKYEQRHSIKSYDEGFLDNRLSQVCIDLLNSQIEFNDTLRISASILATTSFEQVLVRVLIRNSKGDIAAEWNSLNHDLIYTINSGGTDWILELAQVRLRGGNYGIEIELLDLCERRTLAKIRATSQFVARHPHGGSFLLHSAQA